MLRNPAVNMSPYLDPSYENMDRIRANSAQAHFARMASDTALEMIIVGADEQRAQELLRVAAGFAGEWLGKHPETEPRLQTAKWLYDTASAYEVLFVEQALTHGRVDEKAASECTRWTLAYIANEIKPRSRGAAKSDVLFALWRAASVGQFNAAEEVVRLARGNISAVASSLIEIAENPQVLSDQTHAASKAVRRELGRRAREFATTDGGFAQVLEGLRTLEWRLGTAGLTFREALLRLYAYIPKVDPPSCLIAELAKINAKASDSLAKGQLYGI